jgi:Aldo/keto reductases, related to diketogulonate reductase
MYRNESAVGAAVRESGLDRGDVFISASPAFSAFFRKLPNLKLVCPF